MGEVLSIESDAVVMRRGDLDAILQTLVSLQAVSARAAALLCDRLDLHDAVLDPDSPDFASISDGMPGDLGDHEPGGDEESAAWIEWHTMRGSQKRGPNLTAGHEDDEDDDQDACLAAEDQGTAGGRWFEVDGRAGDDQDAEHEHDDEREQMPNDVPMLPVFTAEHNIFTDQRVSLGFSNLQTSFRSSEPVKSADSGNVLMPPRDHRIGPGVPV